MSSLVAEVELYKSTSSQRCCLHSCAGHSHTNMPWRDRFRCRLFSLSTQKLYTALRTLASETSCQTSSVSFWLRPRSLLVLPYLLAQRAITLQSGTHSSFIRPPHSSRRAKCIFRFVELGVSPKAFICFPILLARTKCDRLLFFPNNMAPTSSRIDQYLPYSCIAWDLLGIMLPLSCEASRRGSSLRVHQSLVWIFQLLVGMLAKKVKRRWLSFSVSFGIPSKSWVFLAHTYVRILTIVAHRFHSAQHLRMLSPKSWSYCGGVTEYCL